ncbi:MAG: aldehyde dehydrogenase family protein [Deltaproteobacteria bacterium]|nr:aldehyde dehydrogenase family protein [Deltaproteobacteria bacterium]
MPELQTALALLRRGHERDPMPSLAVRRDRLDRLHAALAGSAERLCSTIDADFGGRSRQETMLADIVATLDGLRHLRRHLGEWCAPRRVSPHLAFRPSRATVFRAPRGVVGIIAPWNYPVNLALAPLGAALAAGNTAFLKPSELTPRTAAALGRMLRDAFSGEEVAVVEGGPDVAEALTRQPLDHLFFTGSTAVGKRVATAAAASLVPVTLELGGKSPALLCPGAPVATAAARIASGKLFNAGQTCIAPDYALLPEGSVEVFVDAFGDAVASMGGCGTSIASDRHHARLLEMCDEAESAGATVVTVGTDGPGRRLAPRLVLGAPPDCRLWTEEIFGPVLPIAAYRTLDEALDRVRAGPRPLAAYVFHASAREGERILSRLPCGGGTVNDTLVHFASENLPFGGTGASGMGAYHGRAGFEAFTQPRSVLAASSISPARALLSPPYGRAVDLAARFLAR